VKFFSDGALGSLTAWMHEPYATSETCGFPLQPIEELERDVARSLEAGLAPAIHAIGDRANHEVLNLYERQSGRTPDLVRRIEHAQVLVEDDILRFAPLGIIASMQPIHATADWRKVDREWGSRGRLAYAFASLSRAGTSLAFGSDSPVETMDPLAGVRAAVARTTAQDEPAGGWHPEERLLLDDALRAYTAGVAAASGESSRIGTISAGQLADFVVLSDDPFALPNERKLSRIRVELTAVGGNVAFERT
jgi:predicted amidohydrolase YtcJ